MQFLTATLAQCTVPIYKNRHVGTQFARGGGAATMEGVEQLPLGIGEPGHAIVAAI